MLSALSGVVALVGGRVMRALVGGIAALGIWDELGLQPRCVDAPLVRTRTTSNVVAELGSRDAEACVVVIAHHDAAHSGAVFDPTVTHALARRFPHVLDRMRWWPRIMGLVFAGPNPRRAWPAPAGRRAVLRLGGGVRRHSVARRWSQEPTTT